MISCSRGLICVFATGFTDATSNWGLAGGVCARKFVQIRAIAVHAEYRIVNLCFAFLYYLFSTKRTFASQVGRCYGRNAWLKKAAAFPGIGPATCVSAAISAIIEEAMTVAQVEIPEDQIVELCRRQNIKKLALFGSVLTARFSEQSDIDVLVEFRPGTKVGFFRLADIEAELSGLFGGRKIDLRTPMDLSRYFREDVVRDALIVYAEA